MDGQMDAWMAGWTDGHVDGWTDRQTCGWVGGWTDGWMRGWLVDRRTHGWMDRQTDAWWTDRRTDRHVDGWTDRHVDGWTAGHTGGQTDRQMDRGRVGACGGTGACRTDGHVVLDGSPRTGATRSPHGAGAVPVSPSLGGARPRCSPSLSTGTPRSRSTHGMGTPGVPPAVRPHPWVPPGTLLSPDMGTALGQSPFGTRAPTQTAIWTRAADQSEPPPPPLPRPPPLYKPGAPQGAPGPAGCCWWLDGDTRWWGGRRLGRALLHTSDPCSLGGGTQGTPPHSPPPALGTHGAMGKLRHGSPAGPRSEATPMARSPKPSLCPRGHPTMLTPKK